jgi:hypothetical protein
MSVSTPLATSRGELIRHFALFVVLVATNQRSCAYLRAR